MAISSPGIGSGLDVNSIVSGLMNVERQPLQVVAAKKTAYQSQVSAYGTLKSALSTFQTAASALASPTKFNAQNAISSNLTAFTATTNGKAGIADYAVSVNQLAKSQKLAMSGVANVADPIGTGKITISFGTFTPAVVTPPSPSSFTANTAKTDVVINIGSSNNSLTGIRDAINASKSSVSASIVNDGTTNRLVITSKDTGEVNSLKITVADDDTTNGDAAGLSQLAYDPTQSIGAGKNLSQLQEAKNALLNIDGIAIVKPSNTITDAIDGITLNLLSTTTTSANLSVSNNQDKIKESVTSFVDAYNKLDTTLRALTKYDSAGASSGALLGDATARSITSQIKSVMTKSIDTGGSLTNLSQIGVTFQRDGKMALDATKLSTAVTNNFSEITALFAASGKASDPLIEFSGSSKKTQAGVYAVNVSQLGTSLVSVAGSINGAPSTGTGNTLVGATGDASEGLSIKVNGGALGARGTINFTIGYAAQLDNVIGNLLNTDGLLAARTEGLKTSITRLDKQTEQFNARLVSVEARYRAQYSRLDTALASMSKTSAFLTQQINALNANSNQ
jgi:flagellar hook-associated protein 2